MCKSAEGFYINYPVDEEVVEPGDVIDEVLLAWKPGHFKAARDLAFAAMRYAGINPAYIDNSLESLAADLIEHDERADEK